MMSVKWIKCIRNQNQNFFIFQMQNSIKEKKFNKHLPTQKGATIRGNESNNKKVRTLQSFQNEYLNRRVITETSQKGLSEEIKKVRKQFKLPFRSVSPKIKPFNLNPNHKSSTIVLKKTSKIKSPNKSKGLTETGPIIKRISSNLHQKLGKEKNSIFAEVKEEKKIKFNNKLKSPTKKVINNRDSKVKKQSNTVKKFNLKTQGSFDSTSSCLFMNEVDIIGLIGQGTFGQVFKGRLRQTGEIVAIKRVLQDKKYKNREIEMVNMLSNDFVMKVLGTYITYEQGKQYLNIIMTHYDCDLYYYIKQHEKKGVPNFDIKIISYQIFRGLLYIHSRGICHRDIKPHNILLKGKNSVICDFGSAKILKQGEPNLPYICSRCYRAPQLIFGATHYTTMIDIWSMGCVILEMLNQVPLFIGESSIDHLIQVIKVMGTPTKSQVIDMNPEYDLNDYKFPRLKKKQWNKVFPNADPLLIDLLEQIMIYSPKQRLTAAEALAHQYFDELREQENYDKIVKSTGIEHFFDFGEEQLAGNEHLVPKLIPQWYIF